MVALPIEVIVQSLVPFLSGQEQEVLLASSAALYAQRKAETLASFRSLMGEKDVPGETLSLAELQSLKFFCLFQRVLSQIPVASECALMDQVEMLRQFVNSMSVQSQALVMTKIPLLSNKPTLPCGAIDHLCEAVRHTRGC